VKYVNQMQQHCLAIAVASKVSSGIGQLPASRTLHSGSLSGDGNKDLEVACQMLTALHFVSIGRVCVEEARKLKFESVSVSNNSSLNMSFQITERLSEENSSVSTASSNETNLVHVDGKRSDVEEVLRSKLESVKLFASNNELAHNTSQVQDSLLNCDCLIERAIILAAVQDVKQLLSELELWESYVISLETACCKVCEQNKSITKVELAPSDSTPIQPDENLVENHKIPVATELVKELSLLKRSISKGDRLPQRLPSGEYLDMSGNYAHVKPAAKRSINADSTVSLEHFAEEEYETMALSEETSIVQG
jgi:hypothetical protein